MSKHRRVALAVLVTVLAHASSAHADVRTEARAHFKRGMRFIANGRYEDGISELERAYELVPHPSVLFNIARANAEAGSVDTAIATFKRYLEGNPPDRDEVLRLVAALEEQQRRLELNAAAALAVAPAGGAPDAAPRGGPGDVSTTDPGAPADGSSSPTAQAPSAAPTVSPPPEVHLEAKTDEVFDETVVTASRGAQSPLDAPNSTSIITQQDIRLSGITKIPELLRRLAGVDILEGSGAQTEVSLRGFNQRLSNKVLVLVNGRSVYVDLLGATFWATLSIGVEDIDRIEVVRGPGSALYGADAFNGVINIITKAPGDGNNGVNAGYGDRSAAHASAWTSGRKGGFAWRLSGGYDALPRWSKEVDPQRVDVALGRADQDVSQRFWRADLRTTQDLGRGVTLGVGGGYARGDHQVLGTGTLNDVVLDGYETSDATMYLSSKHVQARVFWNRYAAASQALNFAYLGQSLAPASPEANVVDGEVQYVVQFPTGPLAHDLHVGSSYRYKDVRWTFLDGPRSEHHAAAFLHDAISLGPAVSLVGDIRVDYVPYLQRVIPSPRGSILVHPSKRSTVRGVFATAFRKPTFLESYLRFPVQLPIQGAQQLYEGAPSVDPSFRVQQEKVVTAELGYMNQESDWFALDAAMFYNRVSDIIALGQPRPVTLADRARGLAEASQDGRYTVTYGTWENRCSAYDMFGAEVGVRTFPVEGLDVYGNYTLNRVVQDDGGCAPEEKARLVTDQRTSLHKLNAGVQLRTKAGIDGSVDIHYVSPQTWAEQVANVERQAIEYRALPVEAYTLLNARVGYRFLKNQAEVSVMVFNLLGQEHREHPLAQTVSRRVMGFVSYLF